MPSALIQLLQDPLTIGWLTFIGTVFAMGLFGWLFPLGTRGNNIKRLNSIIKNDITKDQKHTIEELTCPL